MNKRIRLHCRVLGNIYNGFEDNRHNNTRVPVTVKKKKNWKKATFNYLKNMLGFFGGKKNKI